MLSLLWITPWMSLFSWLERQLGETNLLTFRPLTEVIQNLPKTPYISNVQLENKRYSIKLVVSHLKFQIPQRNLWVQPLVKSWKVSRLPRAQMHRTEVEIPSIQGKVDRSEVNWHQWNKVGNKYSVLRMTAFTRNGRCCFWLMLFLPGSNVML